MIADAYEKLRKYMDQINPLGYPKTEDGTEIELLKHFFSPQQAESYIHTTLTPEPPEVIAERMGIDVEEAVQRLESMIHDGLAMSFPVGDKTIYSAVPFVPGIIELNIDRLEGAEFSDKFFHFIEKGWGSQYLDTNITPFQRTVPVSASISSEQTLLPYERVDEVVEKVPRPRVVLDCYCRKLKVNAGKGCGKPLENCFCFGPFAEHFLRKGVGREVDDNEFKRIMNQCDEAGLVSILTNSASLEDQIWMCNCCGCCCGMISIINKLSPEGDEIGVLCSPRFVASINVEKCSGCEICVERCQTLALKMEDGVAKLKEGRCIGCGLCVTRCPEEAINLIEKEQEKILELPDSTKEVYEKIGKERSLSDKY